jgi:hypothetical protein
MRRLALLTALLAVSGLAPACAKEGMTFAEMEKADEEAVVRAHQMNVELPPPPMSLADAGSTFAFGPVGMTRFTPPSKDAVDKNEKGLAALRKGDPPEAVRLLTAAVEAAPGWVVARYDLARAKTRVGDFEGARDDLEAVFTADFIGLRAQATRDADLEELWKTPGGHAVERRFREYDARFDAVLKRGLRAILWQDGEGARVNRRPSLLRVGVFDTDTNRFVAVAPEARDAVLGYSSTKVPYAIVGQGIVRDILGGDFDPGHRLDSVVAWPMTTVGVPLGDLPLGVESYKATLRLGVTRMTADACLNHPTGLETDGSKQCALLEATFGTPTKRSLYPFGVPPPDPAGPGLTPSRPVEIDVGYNPWGYVITESDPRYAYKDFVLTLPSGRAIAIPRERAYAAAAPRAIVASPDGERVALVWNASALQCQTATDVPGRYKLAFVDVATARVTDLGEGDGAGDAVFRADGELFVQRGRKVFHVHRDASETELPEGVLLVPPLRKDEGCGP